MRRLLPILALSLLWSPAQAQPMGTSTVLAFEDGPCPPRTPGNAAWAYLAAWDTITTMEDRRAFGELLGYIAPGERVSRAQRECIEKHRAYIDGVVAAAAMEECDWGPRLDRGYDAQLPQLGQMRQTARTLRVDAWRCLQDGQPGALAERIVAILRVARHTATDRVLISSLVGQAIAIMSMNLMEEALRAQMVSPTSARLLLAELARIDRRDPFLIFTSLDVERRMAMSFFRREWSAGESAKEFEEAMMHIGFREELAPFTSLTPAYFRTFSPRRIQRDIDLAERYFDAVKAAWHQPGASVILDELHAEAGEFQWGCIARVVDASYGSCRRSTDQTLRQADRVSARLRAIIQSNDAGATP